MGRRRPRPRRTAAEAFEDAIAALISIGYSENEARKQVKRAAQSVEPSNLEFLVRTALQA